MSTTLYVFEVSGFYNDYVILAEWISIVVAPTDTIARSLAIAERARKPDLCDVKLLHKVDLIQREK